MRRLWLATLVCAACSSPGGKTGHADMTQPTRAGEDMAVADMSVAASDDMTTLDLSSPPDANPNGPFMLTIVRAGAAAGDGNVSNGAQLDCGGTCSALFAKGTQVTLTATTTPRKGAWFSGWSGGGCPSTAHSCVVTVDGDLTVSAEFDRVNYVFVTSTATTLPLGALAADVQTTADGICASAATAAKLPGAHWAAWLTTSSASASGAVNPQTKLTGKRGWIRPDGLPFADQPSDVGSGNVFYPPRVDETGAIVDESIEAAAGTSTNNCTDWSSTSGSSSGGPVAGVSLGWMNGYEFVGCGSIYFYCLGIDYTTPVKPTAPPGVHYAFLSKTRFTPGGNGRAAADAICQTEANANPTKVPAGTYQALLALTTEGASTRFSAPVYTSTAPWVRPDGTVVVAQPADLFNTTATTDTLILAGIAEYADGTYAPRQKAWTGADDPDSLGTAASTCGDWMATTSTTGEFGFTYLSRATAPSFFDYSFQVNTCTSSNPVYCLQVK
jgi:hypothetical protein